MNIIYYLQTHPAWRYDVATTYKMLMDYLNINPDTEVDVIGNYPSREVHRALPEQVNPLWFMETRRELLPTTMKIKTHSTMLREFGITRGDWWFYLWAGFDYPINRLYIGKYSNGKDYWKQSRWQY